MEASLDPMEVPWSPIEASFSPMGVPLVPMDVPFSPMKPPLSPIQLPLDPIEVPLDCENSPWGSPEAASPAMETTQESENDAQMAADAQRSQVSGAHAPVGVQTSPGNSNPAPQDSRLFPRQPQRPFGTSTAHRSAPQGTPHRKGGQSGTRPCSFWADRMHEGGQAVRYPTRQLTREDARLLFHCL